MEIDNNKKYDMKKIEHLINEFWPGISKIRDRISELSRRLILARQCSENTENSDIIEKLASEIENIEHDLHSIRSDGTRIWLEIQNLIFNIEDFDRILYNLQYE